MQQRGYLSIPEAASRLGISVRAAYLRVARGQLPYKKWGGRILVSVAELEKFLAALPGRTAEEAVAAIEETRGR